MKRNKKWMAVLAVSLIMTAAFAITGWAGTWIFDGPESWQWWYQNEDGSWPSSGWQFIDGSWYHFDDNGYLDVGYFKDTDGKWYYLSEAADSTIGQMATSGVWDYGYIQSDGSFYCYSPYPGEGLKYSLQMAFVSEQGWTGSGSVCVTDINGAEKQCPDWYTEIFEALSDLTWSGSALQPWPHTPNEKIINQFTLPENWEEACPRPFLISMLPTAISWFEDNEDYHWWYQWSINDNVLTVSTWYTWQ